MHFSMSDGEAFHSRARILDFLRSEWLDQEKGSC